MTVGALAVTTAAVGWYSYEQMSSLAHRVGENLTRLLVARNKKQIDLAKAMNYEQGSISQILSGKKYTTVRAVERAAHFLGVDPAVIFLPTEDERLPSSGQTNTDIDLGIALHNDLLRSDLPIELEATSHGAALSTDAVDKLADLLTEKVYVRIVARLAIDPEARRRSQRSHSKVLQPRQKKPAERKRRA